MTSVPSDVAMALRADPLLPGRDHLLDERLTAALVTRTLAEDRVSIDRVERVRVKYRAGESLRSVHRVWSGGQSWLVSARMRATGATALHAEAAAHERPCLPLRGVGLAADLGAVLWTFPNDRVLRDAAVLSPQLPVIQQAWPGDVLQVTVAGYNPERAVIARVATGAGVTRGFAKLYAPGDLAPARRALDWLSEATREQGHLRVPSLTGHDSDHDVLVVSAVEGTHLERVPHDDWPRAFHALGRSMAHLHDLPLPTGAAALPAHETFSGAELWRAAEAVAWARPDLAEIAAGTAALLVRRRPDDEAPVGLHGDVNSRNWLVGPHDVGLIDFDQAAAGPAAADLAGVFGWLRARTACGDWTQGREHVLAGAFASGYEGVRPLPSSRDLRWHRGAALLVERAMRAVTRVRPAHLAALRSLVEAAHADAAEAAQA